MSHSLVNRLKPLTGFTLAEKSILFQLADICHDGETVFLRMDRLTLYVGCSISTAKRALRSLERKGVLIPQGGKGGRGYVHHWRIQLPPPLAEYIPEPEPSNGNGHIPPQTDTVAQQSYIDDEWYTRRPDENIREYAARIKGARP